jgi:hypothetical protein
MKHNMATPGRLRTVRLRAVHQTTIKRWLNQSSQHALHVWYRSVSIHPGQRVAYWSYPNSIVSHRRRRPMGELVPRFHLSCQNLFRGPKHRRKLLQLKHSTVEIRHWYVMQSLAGMMALSEQRPACMISRDDFLDRVPHPRQQRKDRLTSADQFRLSCTDQALLSTSRYD